MIFIWADVYDIYVVVNAWITIEVNFIWIVWIIFIRVGRFDRIAGVNLRAAN